MFKNLIAKIRQVFYKMGLIKGVRDKVSNHKNIDLSEDSEQLYQEMEKWKALYRGYFEEFHKHTYNTLGGKKTRTRASLGMPKVIAQEMASLVFTEKCEVNIDKKELADQIKEIFKANKFYKNFQDYLEYMFALSGMVIKPYVEDGEMKLSYVTGECFVPLSWSNQGIREGVFVNEFRKGKKKYTHLEWHQWEGKEYVITNEVYESANDQDLGVKVSLSEHFPDLEERVSISKLKRPCFVYIKPNIANNIDTSSPLGISLYANALDTLKTLDIMFDSFQREFVLGKKKIIVPSSMVKAVVDTETGEMHRYYDPDDEVYESFKYDMDADGKGIVDITVELRVDEHIAAINAVLNLLAMQTGFSAGTFIFDGQGVKTATEIVSENSKTFRSKQSHETIIEAGLQELIEVIVQLAELYGIFPNPGDYEVTITFDDSIIEDKTAEIGRSIQLVTNRLSSRLKEIQKIHGISEKEAKKLLQEINDEQKTVTADAVSMFGAE